ncbi:MAG TPA: hypothetical protein PKH27_04825 [Candidatus Desulfobacillus denitrificans]|nr:hypothetical protein [Candidatus Desulfobacillus denitrificans]HNT62371.1 hypothetical protein [Candidatus Desulfobacillus denitrificans]
MGFNASQLATASLIGQIGGGVTSAIGSYYGAATQKATLKGQAAVADINARIAELGAQSALYQGQRQAGAVSLNAGRMKSAQRAAMAANGIDLGVGSAVELQASTDIMKEIDMATIEANAMRSAFGYRTQAINFENEAMAKRATAGAVSPFGSAAGSLLGSAGSVAGSWYSLNNAGNLKGTVFELKG